MYRIDTDCAADATWTSGDGAETTCATATGCSWAAATDGTEDDTDCAADATWTSGDGAETTCATATGCSWAAATTATPANCGEDVPEVLDTVSTCTPITGATAVTCAAAGASTAVSCDTLYGFEAGDCVLLQAACSTITCAAGFVADSSAAEALC